MEEIKKLIVKAIDNNEGKGVNEVFNVLKDVKGFPSRPTYLKKIKEMKNDKEIFEIPDKKGRKSKLVTLTRKKQIDSISRDHIREFKQFQIRMDKYDKLKSKLIDKQKINLFTNFHMAFWILQWKLNRIPDFLEKPAIRQLKQEMKDYEPELFLNFIEYPEYTRITSLGNNTFTDQYFEISEKIDKILSE